MGNSEKDDQEQSMTHLRRRRYLDINLAKKVCVEFRVLLGSTQPYERNYNKIHLET